MAGTIANGFSLDNCVARAESGGIDVVSTLSHGVIIALGAVSEVTSSDNTGVLEPAPRGANLTTITSETEAGRAIAAAGSVSDGEKGLECSTSCNAGSVVQSLGGTVGPAGAAVRLVTDVVDHGLACGPGST